MFGRFLEINLKREEIKEYSVKQDVIKNFIGGKGIGAYLLYKNLKPKIKPLSPNNILMFLTGPITGTEYPTSGRMVIVTKSPQTNLFTDSHVGGYLGPEIRKSGYDGIIVREAANSPTYLWIHDGKIEFRDADKLWGLTIEETVKNIRKETHPRAHIASVGPAGENLVKFSGIVVDKDSDPWRSGIAGRGGVGAVMGSKKLKAIAVKAGGGSKVRLYNEKGFHKIAIEAMKMVNKDKFLRVRRQIGTSYWVDPMNTFGILPSYNFKRGFLDNAVGLYGTYLRDFVKRLVSCFSCPISCGKIVRIKKRDVKIEYENIALLGSNDGITDVMDVAEAVYLCNNYGLDAISTGNVIGFAMECAEKGLLKNVPRFGDKKGQLELIKKIIYRESVGDILAEGVKKASEIIGGDSYKFAIHVKGLELPGYEPRSSWGMALAYATADRGGCHQRAWTTKAEITGVLKRFSTEGIAEYVKNVQDERAAAFSLVVCDFLPKYDIKTLYYSVGLEYTRDEFVKVGERIWNLTRLFNIREAGISRKDDTLPPRMFDEPLPMPPKGEKYVRLTHETFDKMLNEYYHLRGWDENGIPRKDKLIELGLDRFI